MLYSSLLQIVKMKWMCMWVIITLLPCSYLRCSDIHITKNCTSERSVYNRCVQTPLFLKLSTRSLIIIVHAYYLYDIDTKHLIAMWFTVFLTAVHLIVEQSHDAIPHAFLTGTCPHCYSFCIWTSIMSAVGSLCYTYIQTHQRNGTDLHPIGSWKYAYSSIILLV